MLGKKTYLPEELSAFVLKKLVEDAERYLGEKVEEAIISVPAYFNDMARNATKRAGKLAGLKVERIINEPSAAALACQVKSKEEDATMLVFDFGGGTLDVSLVDCFDNVVEILAVSGDNQLGGQDFDDVIAMHFVRNKQLEWTEMRPETKNVIRKSAEQCKRELTEKTSAVMAVKCPQVTGQMEISRADIVKICAELFERMGRPVKKVLMDAKVSMNHINHVVLVGGSCKMPLVQQYLKHLLRREEIETREPDHMIALGCGVYAGIKERNEEIKDTLLTDICPFSLGIATLNTAERGRELMSFIIRRNSSLPISREEMYSNAHDNQRVPNLKVYQGETMYVEDNILLGEVKVDIPEQPAGTVQCFVRFTYDINGVLEVNVYVPLTGERKQLVIVNRELGMSEGEIKEKLKEYQKLKMNPADEEENRYVIQWGERLYMQCEEEVQGEILRRLHFFSHTLKNNPYQVPKVRKYLMVFLAYVERMLEQYAGYENDFDEY